MGAPKGNQFWKIRSKHGRDKIFATPEILENAAIEYFEWVDSTPLLEDTAFHFQGTVVHDNIEKKRPYTIHALCLYLGVDSKFFSQFEKGLLEKDDKISKDFYAVCTRIRETIYNQKFEGASSGFFNANIIARDLHLRDNTDVTTDGKEITNIPPVNIKIDGKSVELK